MKRIADLDEVRLEPLEHAAPAAGIEGKAVIERARPVMTRYGGCATGLEMLRFTGYEDGMFPVVFEVSHACFAVR